MRIPEEDRQREDIKNQLRKKMIGVFSQRMTFLVITFGMFKARTFFLVADSAREEESDGRANHDFDFCFLVMSRWLRI
jgi:hypothetical protein